MEKNIKLFRAKKLAELARLNLDEVMEDYSLTDKEFNAIREAHDSIASARDTIVRLTKPQRMVSAEAKEAGYGISEDEEIINEIINTVTGNHPMHSSKEIQRMVDWLEQQKSK